MQELIPAGTEIAFIDSDPAGCLGEFDTNAGYADAIIGPGACVLLFDNEPIPPTGTGFIEVCKDAGSPNGSDSEVLGEEFTFTIDESDGSSQDVDVLGGQCSAPIVVAAGLVRVTEHANPGFTLVDVYTIPEDRLLDENLINRTADVEVPTSDNPNDETQVHFVNERDRAQLKICKALGPGSSAFSGMEFVFGVVDLDGFQRDPLNPRVTASSAGTQCVIVDEFPIGNRVSVTELNPPPYSTVSCSPNPITMAPGINTVTCTNTAQGKLEICKFLREVQPEPGFPNPLLEREFFFRIDSGPLIRVRPGRCSPPQLVSVGTHTVTEVADNPMGGMQDFELDTSDPSGGIAVTPPEAEVSRNTLARSVTVNVPWAGPAGDEVRVDFYNRIRRGQIKVCKHITPGSTDSLANKTFTFEVRTNREAGGTGGPFTVGPLGPEECALVTVGGQILNIPILRPNGLPTVVGVRETDIDPPAGIQPPDDTRTPPPTLGEYYVSDLSLQGGRGGYQEDCSSGLAYSPTGQHCVTFLEPLFGAGIRVHVRWHLGPNTNTIHFTNTAGDD